MFIDSHCHLDKLDVASEEGGIQAALQRAKDQQVSHVLCIGIDMENIQNVLHIAESYPNVFATVGAHPLYQESKSPSLGELLLLAEHSKVIGIGESGLIIFTAKVIYSGREIVL